MVWVVLACSAPPPVRVAEPERSSDVIAADSGVDTGRQQEGKVPGYNCGLQGLTVG